MVETLTNRGESLVDIIVHSHAARVVELARNTNKKYQDIAKEIFPEANVDGEVNRYRLAISRALKLLIPDELPELTTQRKVLTGKRNVSKDPDANLEQLQRGRITVAKMGNAASMETRKMAWEIVWKEGELELFKILLETTDLHTFARGKGERRHPSYVKIAAELNRIFHNGEKVRNEDGLYNFAARNKKESSIAA
ncbi:MAG: hypothetical protein NTZ25_02845 [Candidatus Peregrinibacteria bacterium]|nr:hypothetical protein [Candidatus Peregrinibacteria bacterium]